MAIYHLSTKPIKRSAGRTATASASYRAGVELTDERTGVKHDYTNRGGVVTSKCFAMEKDKQVELDRSELWNKAELSEKRKDSRTAREVIVNIPHELNEKERIKLVDYFAKQLAEKYQCGIDYAIHLPDKEGDQRNHHAHIMMTTRKIDLSNDEIQLTEKTDIELSNKKLKEKELPKTQDQIKSMREDWANLTNERLKENDINARIDHRSYEEQGINKTPTKKLGWEATQLERRGIQTEIGDYNRQVTADNAEISRLENEIYDLQVDREYQVVMDSEKTLEEKIYEDWLENAPKKPIEPQKDKTPKELPQEPQKAEIEQIKLQNKPKSEYKKLKEDLQKFEQLIKTVSKDLHPDHVKHLENKAKVFVIEKGKPAYEELQDFKKLEPKEPLNPFKKSQWRNDHQEWRNDYLTKLHSYKDIQREHKDMKQAIDELKNKGADGSRGYALATIKANMPEVYKAYEKATERMEEIKNEAFKTNMQKQAEQTKEKNNDRGFER